MALFKKNTGALQPKQGVDKNGRQYTRLVRPEGSDQQGRRGRIPSPQIVTEREEGTSYDDYLETSESVLRDIPKNERVNITPEQLDTVFNVMQRFGTMDDDGWGFRRSFASTNDRHFEWSERGFGSRLTADYGYSDDAKIRDVHLYSISDWNEDKNYPDFYEGQAEIRAALGIEEYHPSESRYLAGRYWDSHILPTLGDIPRDGALGLRNGYIDQIVQQPHIVKDIVEELKKQPTDEIARLDTYLDVLGKPAQDKTPFLDRVAEGKVAMAERELGKLDFSRSQKSAIMRKVKEIKKVADKEKRTAAKLEAQG